jgi:putative hydrolase of HD superfamily
MIDKNEFLDLISEIGLLKKIKRTGWVVQGVEDVESVAEHSWRVAMLALFFAKDLELDELKLVKMSLIHDLGEVIIGDVKWEQGKKVIASQEIKHQDEEKAIKQLFKDNPSFIKYINLWKEFNEQKTKAAKIVKEFDKLEMVIQAFEYQKEGYSSKSFDQFWENGSKYLGRGKLKEYFKLMVGKRDKI